MTPSTGQVCKWVVRFVCLLSAISVLGAHQLLPTHLHFITYDFFFFFVFFFVFLFLFLFLLLLLLPPPPPL